MVACVCEKVAFVSGEVAFVSGEVAFVSGEVAIVVCEAMCVPGIAPIHFSEPRRLGRKAYVVCCLQNKKKKI